MKKSRRHENDIIWKKKLYVTNKHKEIECGNVRDREKERRRKE